MRNYYSVLFLLVACVQTVAQRPLIYAKGSGDWSNPSIWSLNRLPTHNDSILIPFDKVVVLSGDQSLSNVVLKIYGTFSIDEAMGIGNSNDLDISTTNSKPSEVVVQLMDATSKIQRGLNYGGTGRVRVLVNSSGNYIPKFITGSTNLIGRAIAFNNSIAAFSQQPEGYLPVVLVEFLISNTKKSVSLKWKSQQENNNERYIVERSSEARFWNKIGEVLAVANSTTPQNYYYNDENPVNGVNYYRLRIMDRDGKYGITQIKAARISSSTTKPSIYPNPATTTATIYVNDEEADNFTVCIFNRTGQLVSQFKEGGGSNILTMDVSKLPQGDYSAEIITNTGHRQVLRFMVLK